MTPRLPRSRPGLVLASAVLGAVTLAGCGSDDTSDAADPGTSSSSSPGTAGSSPDATGTPSEQPTDGGTTGSGDSDTVAVPAYFVGDTPQGPRLYREFHRVSSADPLGEAAALLTGGEATDPDYRTLWPAGDLGTVAHQQGSGRIVLTLAAGGSPDEAVRMTPKQARLAVQQMVYTLQGAAQTRDPLYVETADGTPTSLFGIDTTDGVSAADELDVLALVNITTPEQGASVSGTFTAEGVASSFEGTVPWQLLDADGAVVADGSATAEGYVDKLYPWSTQVDLAGVAPGDYTFVARTDDPSDGEGAGPTEDTRAVTVS